MIAISLLGGMGFTVSSVIRAIENRPKLDWEEEEKKKAEEEARAEADTIIRQAKAEAELEKKKAESEIKEHIVDVSLVLAGKLVEREINEKDHHSIIDSFIDEFGEGDEPNEK